MKGRKIFAFERPDLLKEWDYKKNSLVCAPDAISYKSNKKVWWKCAKGHSFEQTVDKRVSRNYNCPYCSNKRILPGFNDLKTLGPLLMEEWNEEKNTNLDPTTISLHSNKYAWWKCNTCGNEWKAKINDRAQGRACPLCAKSKRIKSFRENTYLKRGENDLATVRPDILGEWDFNKNDSKLPSDFTKNSNEKIWWKCSVCGNSWKASITNRTNHDSGCPKCSRHNRTSFPEQALLYYIKKIYPNVLNSYTDIFYPSQRELDIFIPELSIGIEYDGKAWHSDNRSQKVGKEKYLVCKENSIKLIRVSEDSETNIEDCDFFVFRNGSDDKSLDVVIEKVISLISKRKLEINSFKDRNSIMKQYITVIKNKSIAIQHPESISEWDLDKNDGVTPDMVNASSNNKFWWICRNGHSYQSSPDNKFRNNLKCPYCSNKMVLVGYNDLEYKFPEISAEWDYVKNGSLKPSQVTAGSNKKVYWLCSNGHSYQKHVYERTSLGDGCPYCSGRKAWPGYNDIATTNPEIMMIWNYERNNNINPQNLTKGSTRKVWWKCEFGHEWAKNIHSQINYNSCPICTCRQLQVGTNDLATTHPQLASEWNYNKNANLVPSSITKTFDNKVWWLCSTCGHEWKTKVNARVQTGAGCPKCGYAIKMQKTIEDTVVKTRRDLMTKYPSIAKEWDYEKNGDLDPTKISYGSSKKVWWICPNRHHYEARITDRTGKHKSSCPFCSGRKRIDTLAESDPHIAKEWDYENNFPLTPCDVTRGLSKKVWWKCSKGHSYIISIKNRIGKTSTGCPYCTNKKVLIGFNDLETKFPSIAKEWNYEKNGSLNPRDIVFGSDKKVWWKCSICGNEWPTRVVARTSETKAGCTACYLKKRSKKVRCIEKDIIFNSVKEAAEWLKIHPASLISCLKHKTKTSGGYHWEYIEKL